MSFTCDNPELRRQLVDELRSLDPYRHAWAIQDLSLWPDASRILCTREGGPLSYLLYSGHPAQRGRSVVVIEGTPIGVEQLLTEAQLQPPVTIRETPASLKSVIEKFTPNARYFYGQRMELDAASFRSRHQGFARRLNEDDIPAMLEFYHAPPPAAQGYHFWLRGATVVGTFVESRLAALASTVVMTPDVWVLASIETRPEFRGQGHGTEVTSTLTQIALENVKRVSLTVVKDNLPAVALYEKLGYSAQEDRVWVDFGAGSAP